MYKKYDLAIIGGGILGLSHAYHALKKGKSVILLEKSSAAEGASIRNFGQIVPSGFGAEWQNYGRSSLKHYLDIQNKCDISIRQEGSIYLASDEDEATLLEELHTINKSNDYNSILMTPEEVVCKYPNIKRKYVNSALSFPQEINADSQLTIGKMTNFLVDHLNLKICFNCLVIDIYASDKEVIIFDSSGKKWISDQIIICSGSDFQTLFPQIFPISDIQLVKLQMIELEPQIMTIPGSLLTGWTIRRYESFKECLSFSKLISKQNTSDYQITMGIHILFKQLATGHVILGDSHEYSNINEAHLLKIHENSESINKFMLEEAQKIMKLSYNVTRTWNGIYAQSKTKPIFQHTIDHRIHIVTAIGGKGMTASLGWAEQNINNLI